MMQSNEEFVRFLGAGSYGSVDLVKYTEPDGFSFHAAVKSSHQNDFDNLQREFQIMCELRGCPSIVQCFGNDLKETFNSNDCKVYKLLMEYASEGSLKSFMNNYPDRKLPDSMIRDFTRMILEGLVYIHDYGYVHCDLKSDNLLVFPLGDSSYNLKISDFGNTLEVGQVPHYWDVFYPFVGTPIYMSPESILDGVAKKALDLWSVGCLVLEMYTGVRPWKGIDIDDLTTLLFDGNAPEIPESVPCDAREFIGTCFARNPEERGSAYELLSHRFLHQEEKKTENVIAVAVAEEKTNSLLKLKMMLKSNFRRAAKKSKPNAENSLKVKKPLQFKKILSKVLRLKTIPVKQSVSSLVSVQ